MTKKIKIGNSKKTILVDNEDFKILNKHSWLLYDDGYVRTRHKTKLICLHSFFFKTNMKKVCDHINRNRLDNRKKNLRVVTRVQNNANRKPNKNSKWGTKGVSFDKRNIKKPFYAYICFDNKKKHIGYFFTLKEAAEAYNKEAKKLWGKYALLNSILKND